MSGRHSGNATAPIALGAVGGTTRLDASRTRVALFKVDQRVLVIDQRSPHHDSIGKVIVVTVGQDRFLYWLRLETNPTGGLFAEEQLQEA